MTDEVKSTPTLPEDKQVKDAPQEEGKEPETSPQDVKPEETIGESYDLPKKESPREERTVPQSTFLEIKRLAKEQQRELAKLREEIEKGATKKQVSKTLERLASEHNIDLNFLDEFADLIKQEAKTEAKAEVEATIRPIYEKNNQDRIDKAFNEHYARTMEVMPQYVDIANPAIIKKLSLLPENANKTFGNLLEETYGHLLGNRKTLESIRGREREGDITEIDYKRAGSDTTYFNKIMADPEAKKKYNKDLHKRGLNQNVHYRFL
jgi:hypothetical protein